MRQSNFSSKFPKDSFVIRSSVICGLGVVFKQPSSTTQASPGGVSLAALMRRLGREGAQEVLVEGGARLATSLLRARAVDRLALFLAPSVLGSEGLAWCGPLARPARGRLLEQRRIGEDAWITIDMED